MPPASVTVSIFFRWMAVSGVSLTINKSGRRSFRATSALRTNEIVTKSAGHGGQSFHAAGNDDRSVNTIGTAGSGGGKSIIITDSVG